MTDLRPPRHRSCGLGSRAPPPWPSRPGVAAARCPRSGTTLRFAVTAASFAVSAMMRMSHRRVRSMPYPAAAPLMAQMIGVSVCHMTLMGASRRSKSWRGRLEPLLPVALPSLSMRSLVSIRSRPEQKPRPAPVKTMQRVSGSLSASTILADSSLSISRLIAFSRSGRFRVMMATWPSCSTSSSSVLEGEMAMGCP